MGNAGQSDSAFARAQSTQTGRLLCPLDLDREGSSHLVCHSLWLPFNPIAHCHFLLIHFASPALKGQISDLLSLCFFLRIRLSLPRLTVSLQPTTTIYPPPSALIRSPSSPPGSGTPSAINTFLPSEQTMIGTHSPVHPASLVDPSIHSPAMLQLLETKVSRSLIGNYHTSSLLSIFFFLPVPQ